jgi:hypothetical protein
MGLGVRILRGASSLVSHFYKSVALVLDIHCISGESSPKQYGYRFFHGQFICAIPACWFAGDTGRLGLNGAVAITCTTPLNPGVHCATPFWLIEAWPGLGALLKAGMSTVHITPGRGLTTVGDMVNVPLAENWTCCPGKLMGSAIAGVTVTATTTRLPEKNTNPLQPPSDSNRSASTNLDGKNRMGAPHRVSDESKRRTVLLPQNRQMH